VRVWFEIWRQLNGFPPALNAEQPVSGARQQMTVPGTSKAGSSK
jgi:hypothetical protein